MAKRKSVSIRDVARESKASLTTVSLILNNRDCRISQETRERVMGAASRLGYRPSRLAQGLQSRRAGFFAVIVPQLRHAFADAYFGEIISAIQETATSHSYKVILEVAHEQYVESKQHLELFYRDYVDGVLLVGVTNRDTYLRDFVGGEYPALIVNNYLPKIDLNHVVCDYAQAGRLAAELLAGLGHRTIGLIRGATEVQTVADLRRGFSEGLKAAGLSLPESRVEDGLYTEEGGALAVRKLLERAPAITGILAGNDKMAIGAIAGLKSMGLRVPEDISVIGCDDMHQAEFCDPPLTTVHTPLYEVGQRACDALFQIVSGKAARVKEVHPVRLTLRKSACPPRR